MKIKKYDQKSLETVDKDYYLLNINGRNESYYEIEVIYFLVSGWLILFLILLISYNLIY